MILAALAAAACGAAPPAPAPQVDDLELARPAAVVTRPAESKPEVAPRRYRRIEPAPRVYRGRRIDLDVRNIDLTNLYRLLATAGGINIVIAPDVRGQVTLRLRQVPWDQVAEVVARAHQLEIERDGGIWLIRKRRSRSEASRSR